MPFIFLKQNNKNRKNELEWKKKKKTGETKHIKIKRIRVTNDKMSKSASL